MSDNNSIDSHVHNSDQNGSVSQSKEERDLEGDEMLDADLEMAEAQKLLNGGEEKSSSAENGGVASIRTKPKPIPAVIIVRESLIPDNPHVKLITHSYMGGSIFVIGDETTLMPDRLG